MTDYYSLSIAYCHIDARPRVYHVGAIKGSETSADHSEHLYPDL